MQDSQIIDHIRKGDSSYFETLIRKYNTPIFRVGISYLKDTHDVEDAMQNTYMKVYEKLDTFKAEAQFSTWITRIMINECLMILRKKEKMKMKENVTIDQFANEDLPLKKVLNEEIRLVLENAIVTLPEKYKSVYVFREIKELSTKETADLLSLSVFNVKVRLFRAKAMLKNKMSVYVEKNELFEFYATRCNRLTQEVMYKLFQINV